MANPPLDNLPGPSPDSPPKTSKGQGSARQPLRPQPWWLIFLVLMIANYAVTRMFFADPSSITIPYTVFKQQVEAGNVEGIISVGDSIRGRFKTEVTYPIQRTQPPPASGPSSPPADQPKVRTSRHFKTQRPVFADQNLEQRLDEQGVVIEAVEENASSWFNVLVGRRR
jgi:cell division protease FtsH